MADRRTLSQINVTPFVDVMLVLLVIFMVTAPMMEAGIDVKLPKTDAAAVSTPTDPVTVSIDRRGNIYIDNKLTDSSSFKKKLTAAISGHAEKAVYLKADKRVKYGIVAKTMADIKSSGVDRIAMVTEKE